MSEPKQAIARAPEPGFFTRAQKAAIVLASLNQETAKSIVEAISDSHLRAFASAFSEIRSITPQLRDRIAAEFIDEVQRAANELSGGVAEARRILESLTESDRIARIFENADGREADVWSRLEQADPDALASYVLAQRRPVAALILRRLPDDKAADVLARADAETAPDLLVAMSLVSPLDAAIADRLGEAVDEEFLKPLSLKPDYSKAGALIGEIVNFLPSEKRDDVVARLDGASPEIAAEVRKVMLTFEDLHRRLPEAGAPALLREVDKDTLLRALSHGNSNAPETVAFLFANISKRMVEQYKEEIAEQGAIAAEEGEAAQRAVIKTVRALERRGEFTILPPPED